MIYKTEPMDLYVIASYIQKGVSFLHTEAGAGKGTTELEGIYHAFSKVAKSSHSSHIDFNERNFITYFYHL